MANFDKELQILGLIEFLDKIFHKKLKEEKKWQKLQKTFQN